MCDGMREPPRPGTELYTYWHETPNPQIGEEHDIMIGDWPLRVRLPESRIRYTPGDSLHRANMWSWW